MERVIIVTWNRRERSAEFWCVIRVDLVGKPVTSRVIEVRILFGFLSLQACLRPFEVTMTLCAKALYQSISHLTVVGVQVGRLPWSEKSPASQHAREQGRLGMYGIEPISSYSSAEPRFSTAVQSASHLPFPRFTRKSIA